MLSTTCSTPPLSPRTLDTSVASVDAAHTVKIDDFHLLQFLSKGGWGQVYLAKHTVSDRRLALKVMNREQKPFGHPVVKQLLIQERKIMESLQGCDWFVQLEASWCDSNNLYIALDYPTDLESEIIRCETLPETRARFFMAEIISDLALDHHIAQARHSVVHRDIKTGNIPIRADGHIVLADFGLSKDFGARPTNFAQKLFFVTREMLGSEPEMAPEIVMEDHTSFGVDFWSAGVTLYVMLTGIHPWSDGDEKSLQLQILEDEIEFYEEDEISEECQDFIRQMLQKEPTERLRIDEDMTAHPFFAGVHAEQSRFSSMGPRFCFWTSLLPNLGIARDVRTRTDEDEFKDPFSLLQNWSNASKRLCRISSSTVPKTKTKWMMTRNRTIRTSSFKNQCMPNMVVCPYDRAEVCFPAVAASVSHASLAASFHSVPSLLQLMNTERSVESILEIAAPSTQPMYFVTKPETAKIAEHVISGCEWRVAESTLPANVNLPEFVNNKAVSLSFRCNTETVATPVMRFRNLLVREAKYRQGHQLRGLDLC
ncbi:hypothetical protein M378DRAFT_16164 [Amanita muscaria Koide BX008]|uniref:non-specific serine/threonine protein kinase n=1 Tax=Amanita muscaria (strain Koide BX008) TaxID=946122 RepID=A0A0C2SU43_AMAMK|nr:hypothetical protein M378DRAFT_16164 [Amanita muscaria Koide BX008]